MSDNRLSSAASSIHSNPGMRWARPGILTGVIILVAVLPLLIGSPYVLHVLVMTFMYLIATVSLRTITISGQFPLAHGAFVAIGAYFAAMTSKWLGWQPWLTIPLAGLAAAGIGMATGYPFARLRALYYAMGSLFFGIGIISIISAGGTWTGGYSGLTGISPLFSIATSKASYYWFFLGLVLASALALYRFEFSRIGIDLKAIAQSHLVASSVGISETRYRVLAVGFGCFFAGIAGAAYAHYNLVVSPTSFNFMMTLWLVMYALVGGIGSFAGPFIGTFVLFLIPEFFHDLKTYLPFVSAVILIIVVFLLPQGLVALPRLLRPWRRSRHEVKGADRVL